MAHSSRQCMVACIVSTLGGGVLVRRTRVEELGVPPVKSAPQTTQKLTHFKAVYTSVNCEFNIICLVNHLQLYRYYYYYYYYYL